MRNKGKWFSIAFLIGAIVSSNSVFASTNTIPATITVEEDLLAAAISPRTLSFNPQIGAFSHEKLNIENTGKVAFYPSVAFTNFSDESLVVERGIPIEKTDQLLFNAGKNSLDLELPVTYPRGRDAVTSGETYELPLAVGAGSLIKDGSNMNLSFDVEVTLDKVMETIENLTVTIDGGNARLSWDPFNIGGIEATQYTVRAFKFNPNTEQYERYQTRRVTYNTSYTWSGVDGGTDYRFEVTPLVNNHYRSKAVSAVEVNAPNEAIGDGDVIKGPTNIQNLQGTIEGTTIHLSWDEFSLNGEAAKRYRIKSYVYNTNKQEFESYTFNKSVTGTTYVWNGMDKGKTYRFEVIPQFTIYQDENSSAVEISIPE